MGVNVVVLGAGAAGLAAGLALDERGRPFQLLESDTAPGGLARTDVLDGFSFDRTGHVLHFKLADIQSRFLRAGVRLQPIELRAAVRLAAREIPCPIQYNLWALGSRSLARSVLADMERAPRDGAGDDSTFADRLRSLWGARALSLFFRPYNEKLWGRPLEELPADCAGRYLPRADVALAQHGARSRVPVSGYNTTFFYPASGRLGDLMTTLARSIRDRVGYGVEISAIDLERRELHATDGASVGYDRLVSTIPLVRLVSMAGLPVPEDGLFASTQILNIRIGVRGRLRTPYHWVYTPDEEVPFHRVGFPQNVNHLTCPDGCTSLSIEYTVPSRGDKMPTSAIAESALEYVSARGLVDVDERVLLDKRTISPAYVVRRAPGRAAFAELEQMLRAHGVWLAGRFGTWDYLSIEEAFASGQRAARAGVAETS
jgi:protoporphyrinogen oxidase